MLLRGYHQARDYLANHWGVEVSPYTIQKWKLAGKIPSVKPGERGVFFRTEDLDRLIEASFVPASVGPLASEPMGAHRG